MRRYLPTPVRSPSPSSRVVGRLGAVLITSLATSLAACGDGGTHADDGRDGEQPCAWAVRADEETQNVAYPDTAATYWAISYDLAPSETLELRGTFPVARYASFASYGPYGGAIDVLTDRDIQPDAGSTNPFSSGGEVTGDYRYTVTISTDETHVDQPNTIGAAPNRDTAPLPSGPSPSTTRADAPPDRGETNRLGSGVAEEGGDVVSGAVIYRVYLADEAEDPTGGAGVPDVTLTSADGQRTEVPTCSSPGPSARARELAESYERRTDQPAPPEPVFVRPPVGEANLFPNPDNVYVATVVEHRPGRVVVVQGTSPTFPDSSDGRQVGRGEQVRYWSLCTNEFRKPYPVTACAADRDTVLDSAGLYTFVISTPQDRPVNATPDNRVTWLDWGSTEVNNLLLLRHMLPDPEFPHAARNVEPGTLADSVMGPYAPLARYCETTAFERGGAAACT